VADTARNGGRYVAVAAALFVVVLAAASLWWPRPVHRATGPVVLILDPAGDERRAATTWPTLAQVLAAARPTPPQVILARTRQEFRARLGDHPEFLVCPDGVALGLVVQKVNHLIGQPPGGPPQPAPARCARDAPRCGRG